jgi:hypothetical protein
MPPLVSGAHIRTFLFADMRGHTRFTQEHRDDAAASAHAGRFRSARQALRASVELQRRPPTTTDEQPAFPLGVGTGIGCRVR